AAMQDPQAGTGPHAGLVAEAAAARERLAQWWPDLGD
ncbi:MAG: hypothetical protein QOG59_1190, partial [Solirubrobacteraceae bacterium]|nr:hypothetical protein [Solirubrobacteraceae bacterium]